VSWIEEARQEAQEWDASRGSMSSKEEPCHTTGLALVTEVIEEESNQVDWRAVVVADPVWKAESLSVWETELLPSDIGVGENTSITKREC
jgi:hypothetical protein